MHKLGIIFLVIVAGTIIGCKKASPEPTLTLGTQYSYDPNQAWTSLTPEQLDESQHQAIRALLEESTPIGVVYLGDRVRVYNVSGHWRPMTFTVLNDANSPIETIRLDLPPTGLVRAPLPYPSANTSNPILLKFTEPSLDVYPNNGLSEETIHYIPIDRQVGIPAKEFTLDIVTELGFVRVKRYETGDPNLQQELRKAYTRGELDDGIIETALSENKHVRATAKHWETGIRSYTDWLSSKKWKCIVLADRSSCVASHNGNNGQPPAEIWWARTVSEDFQSIQKSD